MIRPFPVISTLAISPVTTLTEEESKIYEAVARMRPDNSGPAQR